MSGSHATVSPLNIVDNMALVLCLVNAFNKNFRGGIFQIEEKSSQPVDNIQTSWMVAIRSKAGKDKGAVGEGWSDNCDQTDC